MRWRIFVVAVRLYRILIIFAFLVTRKETSGRSSIIENLLPSARFRENFVETRPARMHLQRIAEDGKDDDADPSEADKEACTWVHGNDVVSYIAAEAEVHEHSTMRYTMAPVPMDEAIAVLTLPSTLWKSLVVDRQHVLRAGERKHEIPGRC